MQVFTLADGTELALGQPFSASVELVPGSSSSRDTIQFPANWLANATDDDLARVGITKSEVADPTAPSEPPPPPTIDDLKAYAQQKRAELTNGSAEINLGTRTIPVWIDAESRGSALGLVVATQQMPDLTTVWKGADGVYYTLTTAEIGALSMGMLQYIEKCFAAEAQIDSDITSGVTSSAHAIDVAFTALMSA